MTRYLAGTVGLGVSLVLLAAVIAPAGAQHVGRASLGIGGGYTEYDLSGTGSSFVIGVRVEYPPVKALMLEAGFTYFQYTPQLTGGAERFLFPELSVQGTIPVGQIWPYFGGGIGFSQRISGGALTDLTLHATTGVRVRASRHWGGRGELRVRAIDPWGAVTADITAGLAYTF